MKKWMPIIALITLILGSFPKIGLAALTEAELGDYLSEIGWTKEELIEYLDFDGLTIEDFETIDELREYLGPPITEQNLNELLAKYDLTLEELANKFKMYFSLSTIWMKRCHFIWTTLQHPLMTKTFRNF
jgi:processed acidic surface protein